VVLCCFFVVIDRPSLNEGLQQHEFIQAVQLSRYYPLKRAKNHLSILTQLIEPKSGKPHQGILKPSGSKILRQLTFPSQYFILLPVKPVRMKTLLSLVIHLIMVVGMLAQTPKVSQGKFIRIENFASKFVPARNIDIWLPDNYSSKSKYSVLYMHDGQMLFDSTTTWNKQEWGVDEVLGELLHSQKVSPCIVVGIWNTANRHPEYFPQKPFESLTLEEQAVILAAARVNASVTLLGDGPVSDNYLKFIVQELKPAIDSKYSTYTDAAHTFIMGSSMGGLISMYAICEYPEVFGGAACLSTHWPGTFAVEGNPIPGAFLNYLKTHLPAPKSHRIYFDYGTATLDALYKPFQLQADEIMEQAGYTSQNWITREFVGEDHSEQAWHKRLHIPLGFLLGN
jgi:enterochelin esterase-like enzyme